MPEDMSEYMPEDMSDRMREDMSEYMPEDMPDRMPHWMLEDMPDRVPEDMPNRMPEDLPDRMPEDMPDHMPENMPDRMPHRMSEDMSDRMPEDLPVRKCINVMVGITRSKVISWNVFAWNFPCPLWAGQSSLQENRENDFHERCLYENSCSCSPTCSSQLWRWLEPPIAWKFILSNRFL